MNCRHLEAKIRGVLADDSVYAKDGSCEAAAVLYLEESLVMFLQQCLICWYSGFHSFT